MCQNQNIHYLTMHHDASVCTCVCMYVLVNHCKKRNVKYMFLRQMNESKQDNESQKVCKKKKKIIIQWASAAVRAKKAKKNDKKIYIYMTKKLQKWRLDY